MSERAGRTSRWSSAATIKDVARMSGVSPATVTRVVNGHASVRPETRARVEQAVLSLGYRPDSIAQALVTRSTRTVGVLVPSSGDSFWGEVVAAIEDRAAEEGFSIILANTHGETSREVRAVELFFSRRVEGMIVASTPSDIQGWFSAKNFLNVPIVRINWDVAFAEDQVAEARFAPVEKMIGCIERVSRGSPFEEIAFDDFGAAVEVTRHLVALGHQRIAFVGLTSLRPALLRYLGFRVALEEVGLVPWATIECQGTLDVARAMAVQALSIPEPPTAIIAYDDIVAIGVMRGIRAMGRAVPADFSVIGFDDIEVAAYVEPPLTTVRQPKQEMGRLAMDVVLRHLGQPTDPDVHPLPGELVVRMSSAPLSGARKATLKH